MVEEEYASLNALGDLIRKYREGLGLSKASLCENLSITPQAIGQYERGIRRPRKKIAEEVRKGLGIPKEEFAEAYESSKNEILPAGEYDRNHLLVIRGYLGLIITKYKRQDKSGKEVIRKGLEKLVND